MSENQKDVAAERDALRGRVAELEREAENLRGQLAASGATRVAAPRHTFALSEGARQELELNGVTTVDGRLYTAEQVREKLAASDTQRRVDFEEPDPTVVRAVPVDRAVGRVRTEGVDYVYPSVDYGVIDPMAAGKPGISGPPADKV
jgi:hypothetical protein